MPRTYTNNAHTKHHNTSSRVRCFSKVKAGKDPPAANQVGFAMRCGSWSHVCHLSLVTLVFYILAACPVC